VSRVGAYDLESKKQTIQKEEIKLEGKEEIRREEKNEGAERSKKMKANK
jgi:hypothetical protein